MMAQNSSHSTDRAGSTRMDNNRSRNPGSRFRWKSEHQNAAPEQRPIHLPPMQLTEVFSYIFPFLLFLEGWEPPAKDFPRRLQNAPLSLLIGIAYAPSR